MLPITDYKKLTHIDAVTRQLNHVIYKRKSLNE